MPERNSQAGITQQPQPLLSLNTHNDNWRDPEVSPAQPDGQPAQTTTTPIPDDRRSYHE